MDGHINSGSRFNAHGRRISADVMRECLKVYLVVGSANCQDDPLYVVREALAGGATMVQYREKGDGSLTGEARIQLGLQLQELCREAGVPFIINDDVELALQLQADGVHIGQEDADAGWVRSGIGGGILGVSVHQLEEAERAVQQGADYLGIGPIYPTSSKPDAHAVHGLQILPGLRQAGIHLPLVGIGGITLERAGEVISAGADGIAVISAVAGLPGDKVQNAVQQLRTRINRSG
ncbi:thiamine-phosphate synthase [Paenibacillus antibioticophila]|uniref:Thiamine-phosphate synthase n=1 Tax=Paenibacillus antibioticophila TaxID=1274374 RepID=A0A920CH76_9BACL|nr:thiamine phosphate synthase [Paenibacillus antibioticophila]GIO36462.1 thiamine-phosphate synthase [Paenibacillus antibioticophila]